jgi:hypothetical protein
MAGKKLTAAERLAKLKAMQGKRGEEFAGGRKPTVSEPPQKAVEEKPSVFDKPPVQPEQAEPEEGNKTRGLDLDDSAIEEIQEAPSSSAAPSTRLDSTPPVAEEQEESDDSVSEEPSLPPLDNLSPPEDLGSIVGDSHREDETKPEVKRPSNPPVRTLLSAGIGDDIMDALKAPEPPSALEAPAPTENEEPNGVKYHVHAIDNGAVTPLVTGVSVKYVTVVGNTKVFSVKGPSGTFPVELAPGDKKNASIEVPGGQALITMVNVAGEITAYVEGGVTRMGAAAAKAGRAGKFLANVKYYLPELTMATLFTAATTAVLWTQQFVADTLQNFHKPAVVAYGVFQLALTAWAFIEQRKLRKAAEAQEAVKE